MPTQKNIELSVPHKVFKRIALAAQLSGKSISDFLIDSALKEVMGKERYENGGPPGDEQR